MASLGDLIVRVGASIEGFTEGMRSVVSQASEAADKVEDRLEAIGNVGERFGAIGAALTTAITLPLEEIARHSIEVAGNFEQTQIAFTTLLGSSDAANTKLRELYNFAATTPFEIPQVLDGARKLMALGFAAKDVVPILRIVGDQAAALGMGGIGMERILMNLGKIEAQGKITGHELRNLGEDDIPAIASIALARHESKEKAFKDVSAGKVDSEEAINAILRGMQLHTGGLMENQMASFQGQLSNLKDEFTLTAGAIGAVFLPVGKVLVDWAHSAMDTIKDLAQWFGNLPAPIQGAAVALAALAASVGPVLLALSGMLYILPGLAAGITALDVALAGLGFSGLGAGIKAVTSELATTVWMIGSLVAEEGVAAGASFALEAGLAALTSTAAIATGGIILAVAAIAAIGVWVYEHWAGVKAAFGQIWDGIVEMFHAGTETLRAKIGAFIAWSEPLWRWFGGAIKEVWDTIVEVIEASWYGLKRDVFDPMMAMLAKIPGMAKILSAGDAFHKAEADKKEGEDITAAEKGLHLGKGQEPFTMTGELDKWKAHQKVAIDEATKNVNTLSKAYEHGKISAQEFQDAQDALRFLQNEKPPSSEKDGPKGKLDRNALGGLSGQHANDEAMAAMERAKIEHDFKMSQPGTSAKTDESAEEQAAQLIAAAEKRKDALDKLSQDELNKTLANITEKLKLYKSDQAGHQALIEAKTAAEIKYNAAVQKTTFEFEDVKKQANDRMEAEHRRLLAEDLKNQEKSYEMALKTVDLEIQAMDKKTAYNLRQAQFAANLNDKLLQFELETGEISKAQYLRLKQEQYDKAYAMELDAIQKERDLIEAEFAVLRNTPDMSPDQKKQVEADYLKRTAPLKDREQAVNNRNTEQKQDTDLGLKREQFDKMGKVFGPFQSSFSNAIAGMIKGTQTFKQAFASMATGMLSDWINSLSQMAARWVTHKLMELTLHVATNQLKVASDASAAAQSRSISLSKHIHEVMLAAKSAAANAWNAVVGIPIIGPVLAPIAAVATFAGVMAFSAEHGAVLPNRDTVGFLHPQEMVLPKPISIGLQNLIASGGLANAGSIMHQGGTMDSTALQMARNTAQAANSTSNTHNWGGITIHNSAKDPINEDKVFNLMQGAMRRRNMKMA